MLSSLLSCIWKHTKGHFIFCPKKLHLPRILDKINYGICGLYFYIVFSYILEKGLPEMVVVFAVLIGFMICFSLAGRFISYIHKENWDPKLELSTWVP